MGLFGELKMATGLGLDASQAYQRAFDKGVMLGPAQFPAAADMFQAAAEKIGPSDPAWAARAVANSHLYRFLASPTPPLAHLAVNALGQVREIEMPGSADELIEASKLAAELNARMLEQGARGMAGGAPPEAIADAYRRAAYAWLAIPTWRPVTFDLVAEEAFADDGTVRFFLNAAHAAMHDAAAARSRDPDLAAEHYALAQQAFGRCGAAANKAEAAELLRCCRVERPCWFCGRLARGLGDGLRRLASTRTDYVAKLARQDRERGEAYDPAGAIFACAACAGAVDAVAEQRADAVRRELGGAIAQMRAELETIQRRLAHVESQAHRHFG